MSSKTSDNSYPATTNEPRVHPLIRRSFVFVPSAGMRLSPEILLIELYREIFFGEHCGATGGRDLDPSDLKEDGTYFYPEGDRAVLHALRGRRRRTKSAKPNPFFAPAYPALARNSWLSKKRERVIVNFLLAGAIAQYLWYNGETDDKKQEQERIVNRIIQALVGQNSFQGNDPRNKDILSVAMSLGDFILGEDLARGKLKEKTALNDNVMKLQGDLLSLRITNDLLALSDLEQQLPRMQWLHVLMTFLRFSLPMWLLAHMRITNLLHGWLLDAIDNDKIIGEQQMKEQLVQRYQEILHPTITPSREIFERTESYMKHRVELNLLLNKLEDARGTQITNKRLDLQGAGSGVISLDQLILLAREAAGDIQNSQEFKGMGINSLQKYLTREAEQFEAWRDPLHKGQGKNIDEFFRVLYRDDIGDEAGGYLLIPEGRGRTRGFRVFPGQLLLKTITFLAAHNKQSNGPIKGGGKLVLEDIENHFKQYGIDFSYAADARPLLMRELQAMGLLAGSPDAGSSVAVTCPYLQGEKQC